MTDTMAVMPGERRLKPAFRPGPETIILGILALFVATISLAPLGRLALTAIAPEGVLDLTSAWNTLAKPRVFTAAINSIYVALASTLLAVIIGSLAALICIMPIVFALLRLRLIMFAVCAGWMKHSRN